MTTSTTETQLRQLREGDSLTYHSVQWQVEDFSSYDDPNGYETEEWLLKSVTGKAYYLMREVDPQDPETTVHWYLAEEVHNPTIYEPGSNRELSMTLVEDMQSAKTPYPELHMYNRTYQFESQTAGSYESEDGSSDRITWDYWDPPHLWNLALEAWANRTLNVYSTREVQPADFTDLYRGGSFSTSSTSSSSSPSGITNRGVQVVCAWIVMIIGFLLMLSGV